MKDDENGARDYSIERNLVFGHGEGLGDLRCDVYTPAGGGTDRPCVVVFHGGGWANRNRQGPAHYGPDLTRLGVVVVVAEYRVVSEATWPAQVNDVKTAIRWTRANAAKLGIDESTICLIGCSAGGHLALIAAGSAGNSDLEGGGGNAGVSSAVAGVAAMYPPSCFDEHPRDATTIAALLGEAAGRHAEIEPRNYAATMPPTILIHGTGDKRVAYESSVSLFQAYQAAGAEVELHLVEGVDHAFDHHPEYAEQTARDIYFFLERKAFNRRPIPHTFPPGGVRVQA